MGVEPLVRPPDQLAVGAPLIQTCLVTGCEQHGPPPWVEREGDAPYASSGPKAKLLHIAVARSIQCVHVRPAERRPERLEQRRMREKLILDDDLPVIELGVELRMELGDPVQGTIMI